MSESTLTIAANGDDHRDICQSIEAVCEQFPAKYWRNLEDAPLSERYPEDFVKTLEEAGFMSALVPEEYDGVGLPLGAAAKISESVKIPSRPTGYLPASAWRSDRVETELS